MKLKPVTPDTLIVLAAVYLAAFTNLALFRNVHAVFGDQAGSFAHEASLALVLICALVLLLGLLAIGRLLKPMLVLLLLVSSVSAYFMDAYNVIIDADMLANVAQTDSAEAGDLLSARMWAYVVLLGLLPALVISWIPVRRRRPRAAFLARFGLLGVALLIAVSVSLILGPFYASLLREHKPLRFYANPLTPVYAVYKSTKRAFHQAPVPFQPIGEDAAIPPSDVDRELVVLVVGETARTDRFSLNGYPRLTNPQLSKESVISFTGVSACGTSTAVSVPCMFSISGEEDYDAEVAASTGNALDVLATSGVQILWRDNNSSSKGVADRLTVEDFRSPEQNPVCDPECRDVGMLEGLQDLIDQHAEGDLLIVLHQMGSHGPAYYKRYPEVFERFKPVCRTNQLDECTEAEINNAYDNTILYTDHFLAQVIAFLKHNDPNFETVMFYVSDHGESLGESGLYLHGLPSIIAPEAQTSVPVLFWFGRNYFDVDPVDMQAISAGDYSHDYVFHTLLGLFEVDSDIYRPELDLLQLAREGSG